MEICIVGLGYVGLTLSLALVNKGETIHGVDTNLKIIESLGLGIPTVKERNAEDILKKNIGKKFNVYPVIPDKNFDAIVICVGTPLDEKNKPKMDYVKEACLNVGKKIQKEQIIVLRSTVPVGTTRNIVIPILEQESKLKAGIDFSVVFAPERTVEGIAIEETTRLPQIVGGITNESTKKATDFFKRITLQVVPVSSIETAEMIKLIDNTYRDSRFAFANEIALICESLKLDSIECIEKANFKYKRNDIPFPSPGVGGPCLSKDSQILVDVARKSNFEPSIILKSRWTNEFMPINLARKIIQKLGQNKKDVRKSKVFVLGFAFKGNPETADTRNSPTISLVDELKKSIEKIYGYDFVVDSSKIEEIGAIPTSIDEGFHDADCVIIMNNHKSFEKLDMKMLLKKSSVPCIFSDGWAQFRFLRDEEGIIYTGVGIE